MSSKEFGLSRWEVTEILAAYVAKREKIELDEHRGRVEFRVLRDRMTGMLTLDFVTVGFDRKPPPPMEPPAVPTFM